MRLGYARVSTDEQELRLQVDALHAAGCERIFNDKDSGKAVANRGLKEALAFAREGDTLVVWKLDRLGRSVKGLIDLAAELDARKVHLQSITDRIDGQGPSGRFFFHMLAAMAEMERALMLERTMAGLAAARRAGKIGGRPKAMTPAKAAASLTLLQSGMNAKDVASSVGVSLPTLYRHFPARDRLSTDGG